MLFVLVKRFCLNSMYKLSVINSPDNYPWREGAELQSVIEAGKQKLVSEGKGKFVFCVDACMYMISLVLFPKSRKIQEIKIRRRRRRDQ